MTERSIEIPEDSWALVEALICRLEAARRDREVPAVGAAEPPGLPPEGLRPLKQAFELADEDATILLLALAPTARPKLGWLYREFQTGETTGLPGMDLVCELLQLSPESAVEYRNRMAPDAPLIKQGLVVREHWRPYGPLRPTARALRLVLGVRHDGSEIPGAVLISLNQRAKSDRPNGAANCSLLQQLVCPQHLKSLLGRIAKWPDHDPQLARWDIPIEHGPIVLLAGPSGTGKTMAARGVAECAGLPLFRVDMGMLVSKYVGDTPKNINRLFDQATREDAILLFDEAEGLFGKRGKVDDARDRYAVMEVGHLLSRIERYPGICLLTTNLLEHVDSAFLRRIDALLRFNPPSKEERTCLWRSYLGRLIGPEDPIPGELAEEPKLTGAQIASACRFAARHLASGALDDPGKPNREEILEGLAEGVWAELRKNGTGAIRASMGLLEDHLAGA